MYDGITVLYEFTHTIGDPQVGTTTDITVTFFKDGDYYHYKALSEGDMFQSEPNRSLLDSVAQFLEALSVIEKKWWEHE